MFVSFHGDTLAEASAGVERIAALWQRHGHGYATLRARTAEEQEPLLKVRSSALGLLMASSTGARRPLAFVEDTAVDPARLEEYAERFRQVLDRRGVRAGFYGHCSVGCLHVRPFLDLRLPEDIASMHAIAEEVLELAAEFGGVNSSEHGDGLARTEFNRRIYGDELYEAMRELKGIFDPENRMNPGKIVDGPSMTENLRDQAIPEPVPLVDEALASPKGRCSPRRTAACGSARAASPARRRCVRRTWPPSRRSTRPAAGRTRSFRRSPRRIPSLRSATSACIEALDLCLECKACKTECPLSVDMAALKSEFLSQYHDVHGVPFRSRAIASIRTLNRVGSVVAPFANAVRPFDARAALLERYVGIDRRRTLPSLADENLSRWYRRRARRGGPATAGQGTRGRLVLFADSFTAYGEPGIGRAAVELLERAGYDVELEAGLCCGRPQISKGLLDAARAKAEALVGRLGPLVADGVTVLGWEPSCVSAMVDDFPSLLPENPLARTLADSVRLVDEVLLDAVRSGAIVLDEHCGALGEADPLPRPLPPKGGPRHRSDRRAAPQCARCRSRRARRRLLRDGRIVRLRAGALRAVDGDRQSTAVPGRRGRADLDRRRRHRGLVPPADRAGHRTPRAPSGGAPPSGQRLEGPISFSLTAILLPQHRPSGAGMAGIASPQAT